MGLLPRVYNRRFLLLWIALIGAGFVILFHSFFWLEEHDRRLTLEGIDERIKGNASFQACRQPHLPVNSPELIEFMKDVPPIDCSSAGIDWVACKDSECSIQHEAKVLYGKIRCVFTDMIRQDDFSVAEGDVVTSSSSYKLQKSDVVRVKCKSDRNFKWQGTLTGIRVEPEIWNRADWSLVPKDSLQLNVLMFGLDSLSRNSFIRKLPKTYKYLTEFLNAQVLTGYNIVGDGTPQALIPILTGQTELELPDTRKRMPKSNFVNVYPLVWNEYKAAGYVTGFFEDLPSAGIFTYRLRGFNETPTDHYMRTYYISIGKEWFHGPKLCAGGTPNHKVMLNHIKNFYSVYKSKPKFLFGFHGELSHDSYNLIGAADNDLQQFLKDLLVSGALENTLLIIFADHGHRFAKIRNSIQGKQEERLPFFSFRFPPSFKKRNPEAYENFMSNLNKLTTPFDIHPTLQDVLHLKITNEGDLGKRSNSLFTKISPNRSCAHAYIEPHWCACLDWFDVPLTDPIVGQLKNTLVNTLNNYTMPHRKLCAVLSAEKVFWVTKMKPNENLVKFNKNKDVDGFIPDLSSKLVLKSHVYQIKAMLIPGDSLFEASITHHLDDNRLELKTSDISRINMYGSQARCIENDLPDLRKYCYCKD